MSASDETEFFENISKVTKYINKKLNSWYKCLKLPLGYGMYKANKGGTDCMLT